MVKVCVYIYIFLSYVLPYRSLVPSLPDLFTTHARKRGGAWYAKSRALRPGAKGGEG